MKEKEKKLGEDIFSHPLPEGAVCISPDIDVLDYCRVEKVSDGSVFLRNDASLLFHLRDIEKKYGATVANSLASRSAAASSLQTEMDNLSDNELFRTIVPKNIQSPSEVKMFTEHLGYMVESEMDKLRSVESEPSSETPSSSSSESITNTSE